MMKLKEPQKIDAYIDKRRVSGKACLKCFTEAAVWHVFLNQVLKFGIQN